jgi:hypothetical protein
MTVADHAWRERNHPLTSQVPQEAFAVRRAAGVEPHRQLPLAKTWRVLAAIRRHEDRSPGGSPWRPENHQ